jgi:hypothetical protein
MRLTAHTVQATFTAHGSPERWLHRSRPDVPSSAAFGFCPPAPASLPPVLGIAPGSYEVDGQRGTINSSDLPEIPSGGFMKTALFQPSLPEPCRRLSTHTALQGCGSTGIGLIPLRFAASTAPVGFCPPSPAPLPPVLGITPGIRVLRVLCDPAARAV